MLLMPKTFTQEDVVADIRKAVEATSVRQTAASIGVSAAYISDILNGNRGISDAIAEAFGYEREIVTKVTFRKSAA